MNSIEFFSIPSKGSEKTKLDEYIEVNSRWYIQLNRSKECIIERIEYINLLIKDYEQKQKQYNQKNIEINKLNDTLFKKIINNKKTDILDQELLELESELDEIKYSIQNNIDMIIECFTRIINKFSRIDTFLENEPIEKLRDIINYLKISIIKPDTLYFDEKCAICEEIKNNFNNIENINISELREINSIKIADEIEISDVFEMTIMNRKKQVVSVCCNGDINIIPIYDILKKYSISKSDYKNISLSKLKEIKRIIQRNELILENKKYDYNDKNIILNIYNSLKLPNSINFDKKDELINETNLLRKEIYTMELELKIISFYIEKYILKDSYDFEEETEYVNNNLKKKK